MTEPHGASASEGAEDPASRPPRSVLERVALGAIALVVALLFAGMGVAAFSGGEVFLGVMGGIGALMTIWAAASNLWRG
jgi:hypothetical protein